MMATTTRRPLDDYQTPQAAIDAILAAVPFTAPGYVLEPCAGAGRIIAAIQTRYPDRGVRAIELNPAYAADLRRLTPVTHCADFRTWAVDYRRAFPDATECGPGVIIGNPPFSLAQEILDACFTVARPDTQILMLLRLGFLESQGRYAWWQTHPVDGLYVLSQRPSFTGHGTDATAYGWFHWGGPKGVWVM